MTRATLVAALATLVGLAGLAGCDVNEYCITCAQGDGGGGGPDATTFDGGVVDDGGGIDAGCVPAGLEQCNNRDDDCDGMIDEAPVLQVGDTCGTDVGACSPGTYECINGALECGGPAVNPQPESCNNIDDDCDMMVDEGDPGGGVSCGDSTGECQRGLTQCISGNVECVGDIGPTPELCDQKDNDCDGMLDEGNPEGGAACGGGVGSCMPGVETCIGGAIVCVGGSGPGFEACDGVDNDCDMSIDEGYDFNNDPNHCGDCTTQCSVINGQPGCSSGSCVISSCNTGWWDIDGDPADCEYMCNFAGQEVCNGLDDDCDGTVDEGLNANPPAICTQITECAGTVAACMGTSGWVCQYGGNVSHDGMGNIVQEADCDGLDNDCDGVVDDAFPTLGDPCTQGSGGCLTSGTIVCNAAMTNIECNAPPPTGGSPEVCNGVDDDCDSQIDEESGGTLDAWVQVGGFWIYQYEASRPDADGTGSGALENRPCSAANKIPWTNITQPQAEAQCQSIGARLCTEAEWEQACEAGSSCTWSYASSCTTYNGDTCNGNDHDPSNSPGDQDELLATATMSACYANWGASSRIYDMSGNAKEWAVQRSAGVNPLRGGSYNNTAVGISCQFDFTVADDTFQFENVGFRCCRSTAPP